MTNKNNTVLINFLVRLPIRSSSITITITITIDLDLKHYQLYEPTNGDLSSALRNSIHVYI